MHKYFFGLLLFAGTTCKSQDNQPVTDLSGAYLMLSQSLEGSSSDTTFTERRQLKIYTAHHMMYVRISPDDSISSFGVGTFSINKGKLTERIIFSATDSTANTNSFSGTVNISKRLQGYEQVIPKIMSDRGRVRLTEDYQLLHPDAGSPLDGTWKLTTAYTINNTDTAPVKAVKYKTYYKGHFTSGSFNTTASGEKHTIAEYGTFRMNGENKLTENITYSTTSSRKSQSYNLEILRKGKDILTLKAANSAGFEAVEKYTRMK